MNDKEINFAQEQSQIIHLQHRMSQIKGLGWNKYRGYVSERIVANFLKKHLPNNIKLICSAFVDGCEHEFDLMIANKSAKPLDSAAKYPFAYQKNQVRLLIEVKASGLYYPKRIFKSKLAQTFQKIRNATGKPVFYLFIWESGPKSIITRKTLGNNVFILKEGRKIVPNEWQKFIEAILTNLTAPK